MTRPQEVHLPPRVASLPGLKGQPKRKTPVSATSATSNSKLAAIWLPIRNEFMASCLPEGRPSEVGVEGLEMPDNFLAHLASPFVLGRWEQDVDPLNAK